jgi:hypothetical protein
VAPETGSLQRLRAILQGTAQTSGTTGVIRAPGLAGAGQGPALPTLRLGRHVALGLDWPPSVILERTLLRSLHEHPGQTAEDLYGSVEEQGIGEVDLGVVLRWLEDHDGRLVPVTLGRGSVAAPSCG